MTNKARKGLFLTNPTKEDTMQYWLPDRVYDVIKFIVTVVMPALTVLYVGLAGIWGFPYADEIARTEAVIYTFLCAVIGISTATAKEIE